MRKRAYVYRGGRCLSAYRALADRLLAFHVFLPYPTLIWPPVLFLFPDSSHRYPTPVGVTSTLNSETRNICMRITVFACLSEIDSNAARVVSCACSLFFCESKLKKEENTEKKEETRSSFRIGVCCFRFIFVGFAEGICCSRTELKDPRCAESNFVTPPP